MGKDHWRQYEAFQHLTKVFNTALQAKDRRKALKTLSKMEGILTSLKNSPRTSIEPQAAQAVRNCEVVFQEKRRVYDTYTSQRKQTQYKILQAVEEQNRHLRQAEREAQVQRCAQRIAQGNLSLEEYDMMFALLSDNRRRVKAAAFALAELQGSYSY